MARLFWLDVDQSATVEPRRPKNHSGARRVDHRRVISGIIHVLKSGCRWCDRPPEYQPMTTIYHGFKRWSLLRFWTGLLEALASSGAVTKSASIDPAM